ncbi:MAG: hypothetical protein ISS82_01720 [Nanoarchaeota archaeon]|nr:hypothetical protein [Nanoarchaeota archaeon]
MKGKDIGIKEVAGNLVNLLIDREIRNLIENTQNIKQFGGYRTILCVYDKITGIKFKDSKKIGRERLYFESEIPEICLRPPSEYSEIMYIYHEDECPRLFCREVREWPFSGEIEGIYANRQVKDIYFEEELTPENILDGSKNVLLEKLVQTVGSSEIDRRIRNDCEEAISNRIKRTVKCDFYIDSYIGTLGFKEDLWTKNVGEGIKNLLLSLGGETPWEKLFEFYNKTKIFNKNIKNLKEIIEENGNLWINKKEWLVPMDYEKLFDDEFDQTYFREGVLKESIEQSIQQKIDNFNDKLYDHIGCLGTILLFPLLIPLDKILNSYKKYKLRDFKD